MHSDVVDRVLSLPECVSVCRGWWVARVQIVQITTGSDVVPIDVLCVSLMNVTHPYCSDSAEARCSQTWCLFPEWRQLVPSGSKRWRHIRVTWLRQVNDRVTAWLCHWYNSDMWGFCGIKTGRDNGRNAFCRYDAAGSDVFTFKCPQAPCSQIFSKLGSRSCSS